MNRIFTILSLLLFLFISENLYSQTNIVKEIKSKKQLINGVKVSPNSTNLEKAVPKTVVQTNTKSTIVSPKPPKQLKPAKVNKYNNNKAKRDEE
jgi:hypothetical protein